MPSFSEATAVHFKEKRDDGTYVYEGLTDKAWCIGAVPHGGYVLALIVGSLTQQQATSSLPDILHITAHYLRPTFVAAFEVRIKVLRSGKTTSNLTAELYQKDVLKVSTHAVFGSMDPGSNPNAPSLTSEPPSPNARCTPFKTPPAATELVPPNTSRSKFHDRLVHSRDPNVRNGDSCAIGKGEYWMLENSEPLTPAALSLFADLFPSTLSRIVPGNLPPSWHPTITISVEFKFRIPTGLRTLGSFAFTQFLNDPHGRHDVYVELWTAPGQIASGESPAEGWQDDQRCLAIAHQMALLIPFEVNLRNAARL